MISFSIIPSSINGTKAGHAFCTTSAPFTLCSIIFLYAMLDIVALVPIIPILFPSLASPTAFSAADSIIPTIGMPLYFLRKKSRLVALTELHAITIIFTFFCNKKSQISAENRCIVFTLLEPYGVRAVSPKYIMSSCGNLLLTDAIHVSPPSPESKKPIGLLSIHIPFITKNL